jgi:hypothetical protein
MRLLCSVYCAVELTHRFPIICQVKAQAIKPVSQSVDEPDVMPVQARDRA